MWITRRGGLAAFASLVACPAAAATPRTHVVTIDKMAFSAAPAGLRVGDVIEWVNNDILRHTATARDGGFDVDLPAMARRRTTLQKAGQISVFCRYHPGMTLPLRVEAGRNSLDSRRF